jgi:diguanylate cyclase (GGDEF)-like protein/PAS domain S-box-containing protein
MASLGSWSWEIGTDHLEWSPEVFRVFGLPETTVPSFEAFFEIVHPDDLESVQEACAACVRESMPLDQSHRVVHPDGTVRIVHGHGAAVAHDAAGRPTLYVGAVQDVTGRVAREERLRESEERNRRLAAEQAALRRVATAVASGATPEAIFGQVAAEVGSLLGVRAGLVWRFEGDRSVVVGSWGHRRSQVGVAFPLAGEGAVPLAWRTGRAATAHYPSLADSDPTGERVKPQGFRSGVAAPIALDGRRWGAVLAATTDDRQFSNDEKRGLERFADLVALAIANADARSQLLARAASDPLTGLANHRTVHETIQREVARAQRHHRSLAVALFDLDHFKEVNDVHGHQVGDTVLEAVALILQGMGRPGDLVGRIGGEEFAWLMPETDAMGAYEAAERFRALVAASEPAPGVSLTVSAGVCDLDRASSASELMALADGALYWAKAHGRNISFLYTPEVVEALSAEDRAERLERTRTLTGLRALARAVDAKDPSTLRHSERVAGLAGEIATARGWTAKGIADLRDAALVHDVGKIGIPDAILLKPGTLSPEEYEVIKRHAPLGAEIAAEILSEEQVAWIRGHHERLDGQGYPDGLAADVISEGARILALADALEVMTGVRAYQRTVSWNEALEVCRREAGRQFDAELVALLPEIAPPGAARALTIVP